MNNKTVVIIGAGVTGLSCAAKLKEAGINPIVLDKGRGIGGRLATRRTDTGLQFDHGAQYVSARTDEFRNVVKSAQDARMMAEWDFGQGLRHVGVPGMNGLAKFLGRDIDIRQHALVTAVQEVDGGCEITTETDTLSVDKLVVTVPAPQAVQLLGRHHPFGNELANVEILPCLTLMATFNAQVPAPFMARRDPHDVISWMALDSSKPGRATEHCWVAQASPEWSTEHLENEPSAVVEQMLPLVCDRLGVPSSSAIHAVMHRWRYAAVSKPLGRPFMKNGDGTLFFGGDWCLGARVEAGWTSGNTIAKDILQDL